MKIEKLFLFLAVPCVALFMFLVPVTQVPDEGEHSRLAWEIGYNVKNEDEFNSLVFHQADAVLNSSSEPEALNKKVYRKLFEKKVDFSKDHFKLKFSIKKLMHLPQFIGMLIGKAIYPSLGVILLAGRIVNALVYIIGMYFVIKAAKYGKLALMFISLLPMMLQQAASLSYDVLNYVSIACFFVFFVNLIKDRKITNKKFLQLILLILFLYSTKTNNLLLLPFLAMIDFEFEGFLEVLNPAYNFFKKYRWYFVTGAVCLGIVAFYFFLKGWGGTQHFIWVMFNTFFLQQENVNLNGLLTIGIFGEFGWLTTQLPLWLIFIDIVVLILIYLSEYLPVTKTEGISSALIFPVQVLIIVVGMYFAWTLRSNPDNVGANRIAHGEQGRYFTPFLIYLAPLFSLCQSKLRFEFSQKSIIKLSTIIILINVAVSFAVLWAYYWV
ncbi:beta-carotene 15,15'-monooxygenase [Streptococcus equinus JB1]|uniref:Beta-carotene 15,15'-monooxygenase n=1 Tax=Streptococcus equinus JB1 TaxID=1294274 RepID=A0A091BWA8_STREI|nr:DUF2142 domain-containing protein [Streptococcus equinus]KFN88057.1 beta-carotene 15,15'-monooxygenase [Streptococcus equinus JB1]SFL34732.1 Predicted membrane protein [Streptococcus equinus JB1]